MEGQLVLRPVHETGTMFKGDSYHLLKNFHPKILIVWCQKAGCTRSQGKRFIESANPLEPGDLLSTEGLKFLHYIRPVFLKLLFFLLQCRESLICRKHHIFDLQLKKPRKRSYLGMSKIHVESRSCNNWSRIQMDTAYIKNSQTWLPQIE